MHLSPESVLWGSSPSRPIISGQSPDKSLLILACTAPEMIQLAAESRLEHSEETKPLSSLQQAFWQEEHNVPIAELT